MIFFFFKILFIFRERGKQEARKHQCVVAFHAPPPGDLAHNPGMCPDWELNQQPFGLQARTQSSEPHQPGLAHDFEREFYKYLCHVMKIKLYQINKVLPNVW